MLEPVSRPAAARVRSEAGFSVIECLIAALILLVVVLGVLPLISQSMLNNAQGSSSSEQANGAVDGLEELISLPFTAPEMTVPAGATSLVANSYRLIDDARWQDGVYSGTQTPQFTRTATVEMFAVDDIDNDGDYTFDTPLDGSFILDFPAGAPYKRVTIDVGAERVFSSNTYQVVVIQTF
jgi:Tfp pilus assembly protein PilV